MKTQNKKTNLALILTVYLLGIFMGAIDTGIVTPARTVIQNYLGVGEKTGIWMITMYTLAYAASIPIMGKLADKFGRKTIYLLSISLFGIGSLFCGLSQNFGSFTILLLARAVQAIGGGGIVPIANAEFGTSFPKEKRGMALGLIGGVYGLANILGASAGSAILDLFGTDHWQFIFYINVPITIFIIIAGFLSLPNNKVGNVKKIDFFGIATITIMILSLLYGLKNIDFFAFGTTITSTKVYPFLLIFAVLLPIFCIAEKKADDPVMNLNYFKNIRIIITLVLSFMTGVILMGMIFVPEFSENALKITSGSGGYFVLILGLFSGVGAPISGRLIDKYGVKIILGFGFFISAIGALFLVLVTTNYPNFLTVFVSLMLVGLGIGFTMGTPLNYMMLDNTKKEEASSALATVSLVRSIGTAIAPAIMIGFISHAGLAVQTNVMALLPSEVSIPELPYAQELTDALDKMKADPNMSDQLKGVEIPNLASMRTVKINMNSTDNSYKIPYDLLVKMQSANVTTIKDDIKVFSSTMFDLMTPDIVAKIQGGIKSGINAMDNAASGMDEGIIGMQAGVKAQEDVITQLENMVTMMSTVTQGTGVESAPGSMSTSTSNIVGNTMPQGASFSIVDMIPKAVKDTIPEDVITQLSDVKTLDDLQKKIDDLKTAKQNLDDQIISITNAKSEITDLVSKMTELNNAVPVAFTTAKVNYLSEIDKLQSPIEHEFQKTLNGGFKQVYLTVTIVSFLSLLILAVYKRKSFVDEK